MRRKVKKTLAFLMALTLMVSLMSKDQLFAAAESTQAETESFAETAAPAESAEQEEAGPKAQSLSEESASEEENPASDDADGSGSDQQDDAEERTGGAPVSTGSMDREEGTENASSSEEETGTKETETLTEANLSDKGSSEDGTLEPETGSTETGKDEEETADEETETEETLAETEETETEEETAEEETETEEESYKGSEDDPWVACADGIIIKAYADKGVLPEDAVMKVERISEDSEEYRKAQELVKASGTKFDEMMALDISFNVENDEGELIEIEPDSESGRTVRVAMELPEAVPAEAEEDSLTINHITENKNGELEAVAVADKGDGTGGTVEIVDTPSEDTQDVKAEFVTDGFSMFAITWLANRQASRSLEGASVSIRDEIMSAGSLRANVQDASGNEIEEGLEYQWYVSEDGNTWNVIEDSATVDSREASYYVARDGARKFYKVVVTDGSGNEIESSAFLVSYYDSLQNGSFETPVVSDGAYSTYQSAHFIQIPNGTEGLEWKTTAKGEKWNDASAPKDYYIEIADGSRKKYGNGFSSVTNNPQDVYHISGAADGNQFAELNCQVPGALYQDILTQPGSTLYWSLEHAGRDGNDTMAVIISNTRELPENWDPSGDNYDDRPSDVQSTITDGRGTWNYYSGTYVVPEGQYVTRFYFVAVGASGGSADGNLLDNITFGKDVPKPPASKGFLTVSKNVEGIATSEIAPGTFEFEVSKDGEEEEEKYTVKLPSAAGEWSYTLLNLEQGSYRVTENREKAGAVDGYDLMQISYTVENGTDGSSNTATVEVAKKSTGRVTFTNAYEKKNGDLTVKKAFNGLEDKEINSLLDKLIFTVKNSEGVVKTSKLTRNQDGSYTAVFEELEQGTYTVEESGYELGEYYCTASHAVSGSSEQSEGSSAEVTLQKGEDCEIVFTNTYTYREKRSITVSKTVTGEMGDREKAFGFTIEVKDGDNTVSVDGIYEIDGNESVTIENGRFSLASGQSLVIPDILDGCTFLVTEDSYQSAGYTTTVDVRDLDDTAYQAAGNRVSGTLSGNAKIAYTNAYKTVSPPTGIFRDIAPYLLMLAAGMAAAVWFALTRRRKL